MLTPEQERELRELTRITSEGLEKPFTSGYADRCMRLMPAALDTIAQLRAERDYYGKERGRLLAERDRAEAAVVALREGLSKVSIGEWSAEDARYFLASSHNPGQKILDVVEAAIKFASYYDYDTEVTGPLKALLEKVRAIVSSE